MNPEKSPGIETLLPVPVPGRAMIPLTVLIDGRGDSMRVRVECCLLSRAHEKSLRFRRLFETSRESAIRTTSSSNSGDHPTALAPNDERPSPTEP